MTHWLDYAIADRPNGFDNGCHSIHDSFSPAWYYRYNYLGCVSEPYGDDPKLNYIKTGKQVNSNNGLELAEPFFRGAFIERHPGCSLTESRRNIVWSSLKKSRDSLNELSLKLVVNFICCMFRTVILRILPDHAFFSMLSEMAVVFTALKSAE